MSIKIIEEFRCKKKTNYSGIVTSTKFFKMGKPRRTVNNFSQIKSSLDKGDTIRAVIDYRKCKVLQKDGSLTENVPTAIWGYDIDTAEYFGETFKMPYPTGENSSWISSSKHAITLLDSGESVWEYTKFRTYESGVVRLIRTYLSLNNYEKLSETTFRCSYGTDLNSSAIRYFIK